MSEHFLEEQIKRLREMSELFTRVHGQAAELVRQFERDRAAPRTSPPPDVRDRNRQAANDEPSGSDAIRSPRAARTRRR